MNLPCTTCGGSGKWLRPLPPGKWGIVRTPETCPTCLGTGFVWHAPTWLPMPAPPQPDPPMFTVGFSDGTHYVPPTTTADIVGSPPAPPAR